MYRYLLPCFVFLLFAIPASAQKSGKIGLGVGLSTGDASVSGKVWANDKLAVRLQLGFQSVSNGVSTTDFNLGGGLEYHWAVDKVSPYIVGMLMYASDDQGATDLTSFSLFAGWGAEYWWEKNFTAGGDAGISFTSTSNGADVTTFGTGQSTIRLTYYF